MVNNNITVTVDDNQLAALTAAATNNKFADATAFVQDNVDKLTKSCRDELRRTATDEATSTELAELAAKIAARKAMNGGGK